MVLCCEGAKHKHQALGGAGSQLQPSNEFRPGAALMVEPCNERAKLIAFDGLLDCPELIDGPIRLHD
jgi:hypothetical protein